MTRSELRQLRKSLGWSQTTAANSLGVVLRTYRHYEAGTTSRGRSDAQVPRAVALAMLAQRFIREAAAEAAQPIASESAPPSIEPEDATDDESP